jgi:hypothetical protein
MAYSLANVTSASGFSVFVAEDYVDGYPMAPLKLVYKENFFIPQHGNSMLRLWFKAQAANYATGFTAVTGSTQVTGALLTRWGRNKMGIPGLEAF